MIRGWKMFKNCFLTNIEGYPFLKSSVQIHFRKNYEKYFALPSSGSQ